jgi:hypothetical protein
MSDFRTTFSIPLGNVSLCYNDRIMLCGSCFVENIGKKLENACFNVLINPFGILFNPYSLAKSIENIIDNKQITDEELIFHHGLYHSFSHHSCFSHPEQNICIEQINHATAHAHQFLKEANFLIITLGTAWIYRHQRSGKIVSSCHKIPQQEFEKELLPVEQITEMLSAMMRQLFEFNPNIHILLTISPVRHIKDGFVENQQSKASLILSAKQLTEQYNNCSYFPVYELFMDDMRDYRFYASDMLHPSETAIQYVWERFCETFLNQETELILAEAEKLYAASQHRPFHATSTEYQNFCRLHQEKAQQLALRFPNAGFSRLEKEQ